mmetsp:Transcript_27314/g.49461  ORF Transcript_27314/g.49461 Transcript_27314/m.49461 type:complete len:234 (-) Transcript_27314:1678-2379(-)
MLAVNSWRIALPLMVNSASFLRSNSSKIDVFMGSRIFQITLIFGSSLLSIDVKKSSSRFQSAMYSSFVSSKTLFTIRVPLLPGGSRAMTAALRSAGMSVLTLNRSTCPTEPADSGLKYSRTSVRLTWPWAPPSSILGVCCMRYSMVSLLDLTGLLFWVSFNLLRTKSSGTRSGRMAKFCEIFGSSPPISNTCSSNSLEQTSFSCESSVFDTAFIATNMWERPSSNTLVRLIIA